MKLASTFKPLQRLIALVKNRKILLTRIFTLNLKLLYEQN